VIGFETVLNTEGFAVIVGNREFRAGIEIGSVRVGHDPAELAVNRYPTIDPLLGVPIEGPRRVIARRFGHALGFDSRAHVTVSGSFVLVDHILRLGIAVAPRPR